MALVTMWPPPDGSRNMITFDSRTYSSTPGNSIQVFDFDSGVLQANGWTTYATVAGQNYVNLTPPLNHTTITFDGRTYSAPYGSTIQVPRFDDPVLEANGWQRVFGTTLQTLSLSANSFTVGAAQGTFIGNILNSTSGSAITITNLSISGALQVSGTQLQVGPTPPGSAGTVTFSLVETLASATNSPNTTSGLSVIENSGTSSNTLDWSNAANSGILFWLKAA